MKFLQGESPEITLSVPLEFFERLVHWLKIYFIGKFPSHEVGQVFRISNIYLGRWTPFSLTSAFLNLESKFKRNDLFGASWSIWLGQVYLVDLYQFLNNENTEEDGWINWIWLQNTIKICNHKQFI